jgi:transposase
VSQIRSNPLQHWCFGQFGAAKGGQSLAAVSKILGIADQTLHNWVKADREGRLQGPGSLPVSAEQMEIARLRAANARLKMERDILEKATAYFAKVRQ